MAASSNNPSKEMKLELLSKVFDAVDSTWKGKYEISTIGFVPYTTESKQPGIKVDISTVARSSNVPDFFTPEKEELIHSDELGTKIRELCKGVRDSEPGDLSGGSRRDSSTEDFELEAIGVDKSAWNDNCPGVEFVLARLPPGGADESDESD